MSNKENNASDEKILQDGAIEKEQQTEVNPDITAGFDLRDERIAELESILTEVQKRERDNLLRSKAEIENVRRRSEQDIEKVHKFALERFVGELLPVIDNLERALEMSNRSNSEVTSFIEGIELTLKSLLDTVHKFGLDVVEKIYIPFNPEVHQAMTMVESEEHEPNQVIMIMQKGYTLNGRLIRPAMVAVSKAVTNQN